MEEEENMLGPVSVRVWVNVTVITCEGRQLCWACLQLCKLQQQQDLLLPHNFTTASAALLLKLPGRALARQRCRVPAAIEDNCYNNVLDIESKCEAFRRVSAADAVKDVLPQ
jgi:hypothetical protein